MIREHAFNSAWWGAPVGIVESPAFFSAGQSEREEALRKFSWVEFKAPLSSSPAPEGLRQAGFAFVDTQLHFRLGLEAVENSESLKGLAVQTASERPFNVTPDELMPFEHERFAHLPGMTQARLSDRYVAWAKQLIIANPDFCLEISADGAPQGWFLAQSAPSGLQLTLAMLHRAARVSGMYLYQRAMVAFAGKGARVGFASFSASNSPVHNIYARLGALFTEPEGCWLWVKGR